MQNGIKLNDASKELNVSTYKIKQYICLGKLEEVTGVSPRMVTIESVIRLREEMKRAATNDSDLHEPFIPGLFSKSIRLIDFRGGYYKTKSNHPENLLSNMLIGATEDGYVVNLTTRRPLPIQLADHDYRQVAFTNANKRIMCLMLHRIIAFAWCPNGRFAPVVHHIDSDVANNAANNLIWLFGEEHRKAHQLFDAAKESGDDTEYNTYIQHLRELNEWTPTQRDKGICWIADEDNTGSGIYLLWITEEAYLNILNGASVDDLKADDIYMELADCRPQRTYKKLIESMEEE